MGVTGGSLDIFPEQSEPTIQLQLRRNSKTFSRFALMRTRMSALPAHSILWRDLILLQLPVGHFISPRAQSPLRKTNDVNA